MPAWYESFSTFGLPAWLTPGGSGEKKRKRAQLEEGLSQPEAVPDAKHGWTRGLGGSAIAVELHEVKARMPPIAPTLLEPAGLTQQPHVGSTDIRAAGSLSSTILRLKETLNLARPDLRGAVRADPAAQHSDSPQPQPAAVPAARDRAALAGPSQPSAVKPRQLSFQFDAPRARPPNAAVQQPQQWQQQHSAHRQRFSEVLQGVAGVQYKNLTGHAAYKQLVSDDQLRERQRMAAQLQPATQPVHSLGYLHAHSHRHTAAAASVSSQLDIVDLTEEEESRQLEHKHQAAREQADMCRAKITQQLKKQLQYQAASSFAYAVTLEKSVQHQLEAARQEHLQRKLQQHEQQVAGIQHTSGAAKAALLLAPSQPSRPSGLAAQPAKQPLTLVATAQPAQQPARAAADEGGDDEVIELGSDDEEEVELLEEELEEEEVEGSQDEGVDDVDDEEAEDDEGPQSSAHELAVWRRVMEQGGPLQETLATHARSGIPLTRDKLGCLRDGTWLNDEVINVCMAMLQERDLAWRQAGVANGNGSVHAKGLKGAGRHARPKCHFFNTFFLNKLFKDAGRYSFKDVRRWTLPKRLETSGQASACVLDCDLVLVPVHCGRTHWAAACVDLAAQQLMFWDSLGGKDTGVLGHLAQWVVDEAADKLKDRGPQAAARFAGALDWPRKSLGRQVPQQDNCCDCGVFAIKFIECASAGRSFDFSQGHIPCVRRALLSYIMAGTWAP